MKGFFKFTGAALAVAALASCTSDDLIGGFGANTNVKGLQVTVEELIDPVTTRAAYAGSQDNKLFFEAEDQIWAFNENLTKYDKYSFNTASGLFVCDKGDNPNLTAPVYALLQSKEVKGESKKIDLVDSGWDYETNNTYAQYYIPSEFTVVEDNENEGVEATKSYIPLWGTAEADEALGIKTTMKYLTAVLRLELDDVPGSADYIYVEAYEDKGGKNPAHIASSGSDRTRGYFEAVLATGEEVNANAALKAVESQKDNYSHIITIDVKDVNRAKTYLYVPIIEGEYGLVRVSYHKGDKLTDSENIQKKATVMKVFSGVKFVRGGLYKTAYDGFVVGGETPSAISKALASRATTATSDINLTADENTHMDYMKDVANDDTIKLPAGFGHDITVNLKNLYVNAGEEATKGEVLYITGNGFANKFTLNIATVSSDVKKIMLDAETTDVVLIGNLNVEVEGRAKSLTIGDGTEAGATTVAALTVYAETEAVTVKNKSASGKISLSDEQPKDAVRTVNVDGTVDGIAAQVKNTFKEDANITVTIAETGKVTSTVQVSGTVTNSGIVQAGISCNGNVTISRTSEGEAVTSMIYLWGAGNKTLTLSGGYVKELKLAGNGNVTLVNTETANVPTAIKTVSDASNGKMKLILDTSVWGGKPVNTSTENNAKSYSDYLTTTFETTKVGILTASQLAAYAGTTAVELMQNMNMNNAAFTPLASLTQEFDGNFKTIENLKITDQSEVEHSGSSVGVSAGLFRKISANVKNLTLKNVSLALSTKSASGKTYDNHNGVGALAGAVESSSNVNIINVSVTGSLEATTEVISLGGLVGKNEGTLTIEGGQDKDESKGIAAADYTAVNLTKIKGQTNLGGLVGSTAGSVTVTKYAAQPQAFDLIRKVSTNTSKTDVGFGTVGTYVGSVLTNGSVDISSSNTDKDKGWTNRKTGVVKRGDLGFENNWTTEGAGGEAIQYYYYGGTEEVGYSPATTGQVKVGANTFTLNATLQKATFTNDGTKFVSGTILFNLYVEKAKWQATDYAVAQ